MKFLTKIIFIFNLFIIISGYKILGIFPTVAKSHFIVGSALMKGLVDNGHEITMISQFPQKTPIQNWTDIPLKNIADAMRPFESLMNVRNKGILKSLLNVYKMGIMMTNLTLSDKGTQKFMKSNQKFDVIVLEIGLNEAMLGFGEMFNAPIVGVSTFGASSWTTDMVGPPSPPSYVPSPFLSLTDRMTLLERLENLLLLVFERIILNFNYLPKQEHLYNLYFSKPKLNFYDVRKNVSLILLNNHFSISYPRPYVPNMIEAGGMHIKNNIKPLPNDIKNFIESAKDGCIYFSMGSNLKSNSLSKDKLDTIMNTFKSLKQKILWKFENTTLPNKPDNVFIKDWFPQHDVLAHPNVKLFITHSGLLSTSEAIYHGVPIICVPMFADQFFNAAYAVKTGIGLELNYNTLNVDEFKSKILEILENPKYRNNIKANSVRYRDQPILPLDNALYWIEYVARHKGAPHLHSAGQDLSFIAYHNIDAWLIIITTLILIISLLVIIIKKLMATTIQIFFCKNNQKVSSKVKKQ